MAADHKAGTYNGLPCLIYCSLGARSPNKRERRAHNREASMISRRFFLSISVVGAVLTPVLTHAQQWPTRNITLLVPYAAGGGTDAIARLVANGVTQKLGQTMVVENNGAAGGNVATQQAARASPD